MGFLGAICINKNEFYVPNQNCYTYINTLSKILFS